MGEHLALPPCFLDGLPPFEWPLDAPNLAFAIGRVADHAATLLPSERDGLAGMASGRRAEYSSGRRVAHAALRQLGASDFAVTKRGKAPVWPDGVVGSIAHTRHLACALVAYREDFRGIGLDIAPENRVGAKVAKRVLDAGERSSVADENGYTLLFSAKEAVYKATNPATGEYLGFRDVRLSLGEGNVFKATATKPCTSAPLLLAGSGRYLRAYGHWLTMFMIEQEAPE